MFILTQIHTHQWHTRHYVSKDVSSAFVETVTKAIGRPVEIKFSWREESMRWGCRGVVLRDGVVLGLIIILRLGVVLGLGVILWLWVVLVLWGRIVLVLWLVLWRIVLGLWLVLWLRSHWGGRYGKMVTAGPEPILARCVSDGPALAAGVHITVGSLTVTVHI